MDIHQSMLIRGPFQLKWGDNVIEDVETIELEHTVDSEDYQTVGGKTYELDGAYKVTVTLTLLASDIPAVAAVLPQHFVPNGQILSTGETVNYAYGAIDVVPQDCDASQLVNNLDIISCANPGQVLRVVDARTRLEGIELDDKVRKVLIMFIGESSQDQATVQMFAQGTIHVVS